MRWDATGYGAHTEKATAGAAPEWYFAEGAQGFFSTYFLLAESADDGEHRARHLLPREGERRSTRDYPLAPRLARHDRRGRPMPELRRSARSARASRSISRAWPSARCTSARTPLFCGGHASAGATAPSTSWFLAEGATGSYFTTFVLLANPNGRPRRGHADVSAGHGRAGDEARTRCPGRQRLTLNIALEDPALAERRGRHARRVDASDRRRARAVLAAARLDRSAQQLRRHGGRPRAGASPKAASAARDSAQTYILLANPGTDAAQRDDHVPARRRARRS